MTFGDFNYVSRDAAAALTEFSSEFDQAFALGDVVVWSKALGSCVLVKSSRSIKTTYPIPVSAAGYVLRKGDDRMRQLYEKSLDMSIYEWTDGVKEKAAIVEAPDFIGWASEPTRIAKEAMRLPNTLLAAVLEAVTSIPGAAGALDFYKNTAYSAKTLFDDAHPCNIFDAAAGTFDNNRGSLATWQAVIKDFRYTFRTQKGPNGKPAGRKLTDLIVPAALEQSAQEFLESDLMYNATLAAGSNTMQASNNIYKGGVNLIVAEELADATTVYGVDRNGPAFAIVQDGGQPEEITYDKNDAMYKDQGMIGVKYVLKMAAKAALPHSIMKATYSGS